MRGIKTERTVGENSSRNIRTKRDSLLLQCQLLFLGGVKLAPNRLQCAHFMRNYSIQLADETQLCMNHQRGYCMPDALACRT